jgi:hypothetical protein
MNDLQNFFPSVEHQDIMVLIGRVWAQASEDYAGGIARMPKHWVLNVAAADQLEQRLMMPLTSMNDHTSNRPLFGLPVTIDQRDRNPQPRFEIVTF